MDDGNHHHWAALQSGPHESSCLTTARRAHSSISRLSRFDSARLPLIEGQSHWTETLGESLSLLTLDEHSTEHGLRL